VKRYGGIGREMGWEGRRRVRGSGREKEGRDRGGRARVGYVQGPPEFVATSLRAALHTSTYTVSSPLCVGLTGR